MDRRYELASGKTPKNARGEVVVADAVAELKILLEHSAKRERDGLVFLLVRRIYGREEGSKAP